MKPQDLDSNDPRRASIFDAFVAAGFAWSVRKKRRVAARRSSDGFEPQIVWKSDANGGRPMSKRAEIRRKIAKADASSAPKNRGSKGVPGSSGSGRGASRGTMTRLESVIPDEAVRTATPLEITGFDLLGLDTDLTPHRTGSPVTPLTSRPVTPRSRPSTRPTTPVETKLECPMVVRSLVPNVSASIPEPGPEVPEGRNWTRESSMDPGEDGHFFRAISCAHRGKYNRALSSSFLRQISPMLRQISPERRQVSEGRGQGSPPPEFRRLISPAFSKTKSEPMPAMTSSGVERAGAELPSSISFQPGAEVQRLQTHEDEDGDDQGSDAGRYAPLEEEDKDSNLPETSKSSFSKSSFGLDKTFSFKDDGNMSREFSWEALDAPVAPSDARSTASSAPQLDASIAPAAQGQGATDASMEPSGEPDPQQSVLDVGASISLSSEDLGSVYLVPPWALRDHLQLDSRGATPLMRESMDRELQEVVKALEQAPALRGRVPSVRTPERPNSGGLVARMRHLVAASPELIPVRPGPKMALGTSLLSMSHPSRSTTKAQLQAQSQAMVKCKMPRQAHHLHHTPASTEPWRIGQDADPARDEESGVDSPPVPPVELSFIEETFFLTDP